MSVELPGEEFQEMKEEDRKSPEGRMTEAEGEKFRGRLTSCRREDTRRPPTVCSRQGWGCSDMFGAG